MKGSITLIKKIKLLSCTDFKTPFQAESIEVLDSLNFSFHKILKKSQKQRK